MTQYWQVYLTFKTYMLSKQTGNACGALWCDDGMYHIAREVQLFSHNSFGNIFLGLGTFLGKYLERACY